MEKKSGNGLAWAAFILGILSLILCWVPIFGLILSIIAIVICGISLRKVEANKGLIIAALVMSIIALLVALGITLLSTALLAAISSTETPVQNPSENIQTPTSTSSSSISECSTNSDCASNEKCESGKCVKIPPLTPSTYPGSSRANPLSVNILGTVTVGYEWSQLTTLEITLLNAKRGDSAWSAIEDANQFNEAPTADEDYVLTKFRIKVISTSDNKEFDVSSYYFNAVSESGVVYDSPWVVMPEPSLSNVGLYPGASTEGWLAFKVKKSDNNPLIRYVYGNDNELWFSLK
jgi:hypothetical protein